MRRQAAASLLWLVALCAVPLAQAEEAPEKFKSRLSLATQIGTLEYEDYHEYDDMALGVSLAYRGRAQVLTIYFYNNGLRGIPDGIDNDVVQSHYDQVKGDVTGADGYAEVDLRREGVTRLTDGPDAAEALEAEFRIVRKDGPTLYSHLILTAANGMFVKVRYSYAEGAELEATANRNAILQALNEALPTIRIEAPPAGED